MRTHDDDGPGGSRRTLTSGRGPRDGHEDTGGTVGRGNVAAGLGKMGSDVKVDACFGVTAASLVDVAAHLAQLEVAIETRSFHQARAASHEVHRSLDTARRELARAGHVVATPEARARLVSLDAELTTLTARAAPILARAPKPAAHKPQAQHRICHGPELHAGHDDHEDERAWHADNPTGQVIDASARFAERRAATIDPDPARELDENRATLDIDAHPVQRRAAGASTSPDIQHTAAAGLRGSAGTVPHFAAIQQSFGTHDVSGIQAHVGGAAAESARAIGAEAYATGDHVAFAREPDLHTAAHEAAHVIQQRGGVQLRGGVGEAGDEYEQHADAVADRVQRGESAEDLLGPAVAPKGSSSERIQRKAAKDLTADDVLAPQGVDLSNADATSIVNTIGIYVDALLTSQRRGMESALNQLAEPPPPPKDPSLATRIVGEFATIAVEMVLGPLGDLISDGAALIFPGYKGSLLQSMFGKGGGDLAGAINKGVKSGTQAKAPRGNDAGNTPEGSTAELDADPGDTLLGKYGVQQQLLLDSISATAKAQLEVFKADLLASPPDDLRALAAKLDPRMPKVASLAADQKRSTMLGWLNVCAEIAVDPDPNGVTFMPHANEVSPHLTAKERDTWVSEMPGFVDVFLSVPEHVDGVAGITLSQVVVNSHPGVAALLRDAPLALDALPVHRKIWLRLAPAFVMTREGQLEILGEPPVLVAIGRNQPMETDLETMVNQSDVEPDPGWETDADKAQHQVHQGELHAYAMTGMMQIASQLLGTFNTSKAKDELEL